MLSICLPALHATTPLILQHVERSLRDANMQDACDGVRMALAEALNNVVEHGYAVTKQGAVCLTLCKEKQALCIRVTDWGRPYPHLAIPDGRPPEPEDLAEGGYGWFLIKSLMADVSYKRTRSTNHLTLVYGVQG